MGMGVVQINVRLRPTLSSHEDMIISVTISATIQELELQTQIKFLNYFFSHAITFTAVITGITKFVFSSKLLSSCFGCRSKSCRLRIHVCSYKSVFAVTNLCLQLQICELQICVCSCKSVFAVAIKRVNCNDSILQP